MQTGRSPTNSVCLHSSVAPLSLPGPASIYLTDTCFFISTWIASAGCILEVPTHYSLYTLLSLAEDDISGESLCLLVSYSVFLGVSHLYMLLNLLFDFLILICLMSIWFLNQPKEPKRVKENLFILNILN